MSQKQKLIHRRHTRFLLGVPFALVLAVAGALLLLRTDAAGSDWYVATNGNNNNSGSSAAQPFGTIQKAFDEAQPGDTIHLASGVYSQAFLTVRNGTEGNPITLTGPQSAVLAGDNTSSPCGNQCAFRSIHDYIVFDGFTVDGNAGNKGNMQKLVSITGEYPGNTQARGPEHNIMRNVTLRDARSHCIQLAWFVKYMTFENNTILNCGNGNSNAVGEGLKVGISAGRTGSPSDNMPTLDDDGTSYILIQNNTFRITDDSMNFPMNGGGGSECVDGKEATHHLVIINNYCTGPNYNWDEAFRLHGYNNIVEDNTIENVEGPAIGLAHANTANVVNNEIRNNTITNARGGIKIDRLPQTEVCGNSFTNIGVLGDIFFTNAHSSVPNLQAVLDAIGDPTRPCASQGNTIGAGASQGSQMGDTTPPVVTWVSPANNATVSDTVSIEVNADDNAGGSGVDYVDFFIDGQSIPAGVNNPQNVAPWEFPYDTNMFTNGSHTLSAIAYDNEGNMSAEVSRTITVSNTTSNPANPVAPLSVVPSSQSLQANEQFEVEIQLDSGTESVIAVEAVLNYPDSLLEFDSIYDPTEGPNPSVFDIEASSSGGAGVVTITRGSIAAQSGTNLSVATIVFRARTTAGTADVTVDSSSIVSRVPDAADVFDFAGSSNGSYAISSSGGPTISVPNNSVLNNDDVTLDVDPGGASNIDRVEFLQDSVVIHTDTSAPYSYTWDIDEPSITNGDYVLQVVVYENGGGQTSSSPITVKVRNPDINRNGLVDIFDLSSLLNSWLQTGVVQNDLNDNGTVDIFDLSMLLNRWLE